MGECLAVPFGTERAASFSVSNGAPHLIVHRTVRHDPRALLLAHSTSARAPARPRARAPIHLAHTRWRARCLCRARPVWACARAPARAASAGADRARALRPPGFVRAFRGRAGVPSGSASSDGRGRGLSSPIRLSLNVRCSFPQTVASGLDPRRRAAQQARGAACPSASPTSAATHQVDGRHGAVVRGERAAWCVRLYLSRLRQCLGPIKGRAMR